MSNNIENKTYTINNDRELFILEFLYGMNKIKFSRIQDNIFKSEEFDTIVDVFDRLISHDKECVIIIDALPNDFHHIENFIKKHNLKFILNKPSPEESKKIRLHRLTFIGYYINERKLRPL